MTAPLAFLYTFRDLLRDAGVRFAITSGMACVYYGLQQTTKDTDWVVAGDDVDKLRDLLIAQQRRVPPWRVAYRNVFGAPLDIAWLQHGWTSHIALHFDAASGEQHLDFFVRPPRVRVWSADAEGFLDRDRVAMMKRTDRDKDWPIIDGLGWQLASMPDQRVAAMVHAQEPARLRELWRAATADEQQAAARRRPVLTRLASEPDPDRAAGWIRLERLIWQCVNSARYTPYQSAWKDFFRRWRSEPDWLWPTNEPFETQHRRLVGAARRHGLASDPLAGRTREEVAQAGIARAAAIGFVTRDELRAIAPPLDEILP